MDLKNRPIPLKSTTTQNHREISSKRFWPMPPCKAEAQESTKLQTLCYWSSVPTINGLNAIATRLDRFVLKLASGSRLRGTLKIPARQAQSGSMEMSKSIPYETLQSLPTARTVLVLKP